MAGLITHVAISLGLLIIVLIIFKNLWYGGSIFLGQLIPDAVKFGITGIKLKTFNPDIIIRDNLFWKLETLMTSYTFWTILGIFIILTSFFLYYLKKLKKQQVKEINWSYLFFIIGVIIHLILDILIIEKSYWI